MKKTIVKILAKSITYEHVSKHTNCLFESGIREINLVASAAAFNLIMVISHMPECVANTELVVFSHDILICHTTIIVEITGIYNSNNSCKINNLRDTLSPSERARERS